MMKSNFLRNIVFKTFYPKNILHPGQGIFPIRQLTTVSNTSVSKSEETKEKNQKQGSKKEGKKSSYGPLSFKQCIVIGVGIGSIAAYYHNKKQSKLESLISKGGISEEDPHALYSKELVTHSVSSSVSINTSTFDIV